MNMQSLSMCWRSTGTRNASDRRGEARQSAGERCPSRATVPLWAKRRLAVIAGGSPSLRPTCPTCGAPTRCPSWSRGRCAPVRVHGPRRAPAARRQDCRRQANGRPNAAGAGGKSPPAGRPASAALAPSRASRVCGPTCRNASQTTRLQPAPPPAKGGRPTSEAAQASAAHAEHARWSLGAIAPRPPRRAPSRRGGTGAAGTLPSDRIRMPRTPAMRERRP